MKRAERRPPVRTSHVLVVDDEPDIRELIELTLVKMGLTVTAVGSLAEAGAEIERTRFDLCLTDMRLSDGEGLALVRRISAMPGDLPVAVITAHGSTENAVAALKAGAFDYVSKPVGLEQLRSLVRAALSVPGGAGDRPPNERLVGGSPALNEVRDMIARLARTQAPVQIAGESGSGKELAARLIHEQGARRGRPFVPVNCGAIPDNLMESEFFGHRKGAFTGANEDRAGFFQAADGGTLFLDEVAELPLPMQVKLLRAIQERRVRRVGDALEDPVDVRIISATHHDLAERVAAGAFRQDLYYRLNVIELRMPPLRERREDVPELAALVLARLAQASGAPAAVLSDEALEELGRYDFPGNVRELENILERAVAMSDGGVIRPEDLRLRPLAGEEPASATSAVPPRGTAASLPDHLDRVEREMILRALDETGFNRTAAARLLGITFRQLRYRMQRLAIREPAAPPAPE